MKDDIIITNKQGLKRKLKAIKKTGPEQLHIVSDFDRTITKAFVDGKKVATSIAQIREGCYLSPEYLKNEVAIKNTPYFEQIKKRKNVILLGDNIGDLGMSEGLDHKNIIKICFLNENIEKSLPEYKKHFDVIILDDGPMDFVNKMIIDIVKQ